MFVRAVLPLFVLLVIFGFDAQNVPSPDGWLPVASGPFVPATPVMRD